MAVARLHTGGAQGADEVWAECALQAGHCVSIYSFKGHSRRTSRGGVLVLVEMTPALENELRSVATQLARNIGHRYIKQLLARNVALGLAVDSLYAVGRLVNGAPDGGTAWACQVALKRGLPVYFYDTNTGTWFDIRNNVPTGEPPRPSGNYGGIGSRDLPVNGHKAILRLFDPDQPE